MSQLTGNAPTRVDIAGGTIDLWPIAQLLDHSATVNIAITLDATVEIKTSSDNQFHFKSTDQNKTIDGSWDKIISDSSLPLFSLLVKNLWSKDLPPLTITSSAKSPAGAGLGGSSCLAVTFVKTILGLRSNLKGAKFQYTDHDLVQIAQDIEARLIHAPTGCQDYWGAMRGGVNILQFHPGKVQVETFPAEVFSTLEEQSIICYSGQSRASAINNWEIFKRVFDRDQALIAKLQEIGLYSFQCAEATRAKDPDKMLHYSQKDWSVRLQLWPNIETDRTRKIDTAAKKSGATFSRVCGAGGGGVMIVFAPKDKRSSVEKACVEAGGDILDAKFAKHGLQIA